MVLRQKRHELTAMAWRMAHVSWEQFQRQRTDFSPVSEMQSRIGMGKKIARKRLARLSKSAQLERNILRLLSLGMSLTAIGKRLKVRRDRVVNSMLAALVRS
jgi:hypothetical protein